MIISTLARTFWTSLVVTHRCIRGLFKKYPTFFSNSVQPNHSCKAWAHTHTFMRNCEKFQADCASHSFAVKCLLRSHNTSLAIFNFQENFILMTEQIGQRYCIKFCRKLGDTQIETIRKIQQVFGNVALSPTQTKEWFKRFKNSRESVEWTPLGEAMHKPKRGGEGSSPRRSDKWSSCSSERNSCGSGNKHWLSSFHPSWGFANEEGVGKICS